MKISKKIFFIISSFLFIQYVNADFVYPFKEIAKPNCRFQSFDSLSSDCKKEFPILKTSDYSKLKDDYNYRRVYTVLWGATYDYGWDVGFGSHQGVDIATSEGTPIYSIGEGTVKVAWDITGWGKTVVIEHSVNGKKVYSNYAHLSKIGVILGQVIKSGELIGKVGNTGNSYGNHLHFQIDLDNSAIHPYYPTKLTCLDPVSNPTTLVNKGYCRTDLIAKTVDPLAFLESNGAIIKKTEEQIIKDNQKQVEKNKISQEKLLSRADIQKIEVEEFLKNYSMSFDFSKAYTNIALGDSFKLTINFRDKSGKAYNGTTPDYINFSLSDNIVSIFPNKILIFENGKREIVINAIKKGKAVLDIKIGNISIKKLDFFVYGKTDVIYGDKAGIGGEKGISIGDSSSSKIVLYEGNTRLVGVPYSGKYTLKSQNNNILFCIKKIKTQVDLDKINLQKCNKEDYKDTIIFGINDTLSGILYYDYKIVGSNKSYIVNVLNWKTNKVLGEKKLEVALSKDLKKENPYYQEIYELLYYGIAENKSKDYFLAERGINQSEAIDFIKNTLNYILKKENNLKAGNISKIGNDLKAGDNSKSLVNSNNLQNFTKIKVEKIKSNLEKIKVEKTDKYKILTRIEFFDLFYKYLIFEEKSEEKVKYIDLNEIYRKKVGNIFDEENTWKDSFGKKYFQPNKEITRGEACYILSKSF